MKTTTFESIARSATLRLCGTPRRRTLFFKALTAVLAFQMLFIGAVPFPAVAGGNLPEMSGGYKPGMTLDGNTLTIDGSAGSHFTWDGGFNIGADYTVQFQGIGTAINKDTSGNRSDIFGALRSDGAVYILNPNGILFGSSARVDVHGLVAAAVGSVSDGADGMVFSKFGSGDVVNEGSISAGKFAYLVGKSVRNAGSISADNVALAAFGGTGADSLTIASAPNGAKITFHIPGEGDEISETGETGETGDAGISGDTGSSGDSGGGVVSAGVITGAANEQAGDATGGKTHGSLRGNPDPIPGPDASGTVNIAIAGADIDIDTDIADAVVKNVNIDGQSVKIGLVSGDAVNVTAHDGSVTIKAADDIHVLSGATITAQKGDTATSADVKMTAGSNVTIGGTITADDEIALDAGGDGAIEIAGDVNAATLTLKSDTSIMLGTTEAATISSAGKTVTVEGDDTVVTANQITGAVVQNGGKIMAKDDGNAIPTLAFGSTVEQNGGQIGGIASPDVNTEIVDNISIAGNLEQSGGQIDATTLTLGRYNHTVAGTVNAAAIETDGVVEVAGDVNADSITAENLLVMDGGTVDTRDGTGTLTITGDLGVSGGAIATAAGENMTVSGATLQNGGTIGNATGEITLTGHFSQNPDDYTSALIAADKLYLKDGGEINDASYEHSIDRCRVDVKTLLDASGKTLTVRNGHIKIEDGEIKAATLDVSGVSSDIRAKNITVTDNLVQSGGGIAVSETITGNVEQNGDADTSLYALAIGGTLTQKEGNEGVVEVGAVTGATVQNGGKILKAYEAEELAFLDAVTQNDGQIGDGSDIITFEKLQQNGGVIQGGQIYLYRGATQAESGKIVVQELNLQNAGMDVGLSGTANEIGKVRGTTMNLTLKNAGDNLVIGNSSRPNGQQHLKVAGDATIATAGNLTQEGYVNVLGGANITAGGDIALDNAGNDFQGAVNANGASVTLKDANGINLGNVTAATGDVTLQGTAVNVGHNVTADNGKVDITATTGDITVTDSTVSSKGDMTLTAAKNVTIDPSQVRVTDEEGNLTITATDGDVTIDSGSDATSAGNLTIVAGGKIDAAGKLVADGEGKTTTLTAGGVIDAQNAENDLREVFATARGGDIDLVDKDDLVVSKAKAGEGTVDGGVTITAGGDITVQDVGVKANGGDATLTATAGDITVNANLDATLASGDAKGNVILAADDGSVSVNQGVIIQGMGGVTMTASEDVTLDHANVTVGRYAVNGNSPAVVLPAADLKIEAGDAVGIKNGTSLSASGVADIDAKAGGVTIEGTGTKVESADKMTIDAEGGNVEVLAGATANGFDSVTIGGGGTTEKATIAGTVTAKTAATVTAKTSAEVKAGGVVEVTDNNATATVAATGEGGKATVAGTVKAENGDATVMAEKGSAEVSGTVTAKTAATVTAKSSVQVSGLVEATDVAGKATLTATDGAISDGDATVGHASDVAADPFATGTQATHVKGATVELKAKNGIGAATTPLDIEAGTVTAESDVGSVYLFEENAVTVDKISAGQNAKIETASGAITISDTGNGITAAEGDILVAANGGNIVQGALIKATKGNADNKGNVSVIATGAIAQNADIKADGTVDVESTGAGVTVAANKTTTAGGNIRYKAGTSIENKGAIQAGAGKSVNLEASMLSNADGAAIEGAQLALRADQIGADGTPFKTKVANLAAEAKTGIWIENEGDVTITKVEATAAPVNRVSLDSTSTEIGGDAATVTGLKTTENGPIVLKDGGNIYVRSAVTAAGDDGKATLTANAAGTSTGLMQIRANVTAKDVELNADDYIQVAANRTVKATGGDVTAAAKGNIDVQGAVKAENGNATLTTTGAGKSIKIQGANAAVTAKDVTLDASAGKSVQVAGGTVTATAGDATATAKEYIVVGQGSVSAERGTARLETTEGQTLSEDVGASDFKQDMLAGVIVSQGAVSGKDVEIASAGSVLVDANSTVTAAAVSGEGGTVKIAASGTDEATVGLPAGYTSAGQVTKPGVYIDGTVTANGADVGTDNALAVVASKDIYTGGDATLEATAGSAELTATAGDITLAGTTKAKESVTATATDGAFGNTGAITATAGRVGIFARNDVTVYEAVKAGDNVYVQSVEGAFENTVAGTIEATVGEVSITADKNVTVGGAVTAGTDVKVKSTLGAFENTDTIDATGGEVSISAKNDVKVDEAVTAGTDVKAESEAGAFENTAAITATAGDARLLAKNGATVGAAVTAGENVRIESADDAVAVNAAVDAKNVTISAKTTAETTAKVTAAEDLYVKADGNVTVGDAGAEAGEVMALVSGDTLQAKNVKAATLYAKDANGATIEGIDAAKFVQQSGGNVGLKFNGNADVAVTTTGNADVEVAGNAKVGIDADGYVKAKAGGTLTVDEVKAVDSGALKVTEVLAAPDGGINGDGTDEVELVADGAPAGDVIGVTADGADGVTLEGAKGITVNKAVEATAGAAKLKTTAATADITVNDTVTATGGDAVLNAARNVTVAANVTGDAIDIDAGNAVNVADGATVSATAGNADIDAKGNINVAGAVSAANGAATLKTTGATKSIKIAGANASVEAKTVTLDASAGKSVQVAGGMVTATDGNVTATAKEYIGVVQGAVSAANGMVKLETTDGQTLSENVGQTPFQQNMLAGVIVGQGAVSGKNVEIASAGSVLVDEYSTVTATAVSGDGGTVKIAAKGETEAGAALPAGLTAAGEVTKQGVYIDGAVTADGADGAAKALEIEARENVFVAGMAVADNGSAKVKAENGSAEVSGFVMANTAASVTGGTAAEVKEYGVVGATDAVTVEATGADGKATVAGSVMAANGTAEVKAANGSAEVSDTGFVTAKTAATVTAGTAAEVKDGGQVIATGDGATATVEATDNGGKATVAGLVEADNGSAEVKAANGAAEVSGTGMVTAKTAATVTAKTAAEVKQGGLVEATDDGATATVEATGGAATVAGELKAEKGKAAVSATGGDATVSGTVTAKNATEVKSADKSVKLSEGGKVAVTGGAGATLTLNGKTGVEGAGTVDATGATLKADATDGKIDLSGKVLAKDATFKAKDISVYGNENDFTGDVEAKATDGSIAIRDKNALKVKSATATKDARLVAGGRLDANGAVEGGGNVLLKSTGGDVNVNAAVKGRNVTVNAGKAATAKAKLTANEDLYVKAGTGDIKAKQPLESGQMLVLEAKNGAITVGEPGGGNAVVVKTGTFVSHDKNGLKINGTQDAKSAIIKTGGDYTADVAGGSKISVAAAGKVTLTSDGAIIAGDGTAADGKPLAVTEVTEDATQETVPAAGAAGGKVVGISGAKGVDIDAKSIGGTSVSSSGGDVEVTAKDGDYTVGDTSARGLVDLDASGNASVSSISGGTVDANVSGNVSAGSITAGGNNNLEIGGGAKIDNIGAGTLTANIGGDLESATITVSGDATLRDVGGNFTFDTFTAGSVDAMVGGNVAMGQLTANTVVIEAGSASDNNSLVDTSSLTMTAGGNIGSSSQPINIKAKTIEHIKGSNVSLKDVSPQGTEVNLKLIEASGDLNLTAEHIGKPNGKGGYIDANGDDLNLVSGGDMYLNVAGRLGRASNPVDIKVGGKLTVDSAQLFGLPYENVEGLEGTPISFFFMLFDGPDPTIARMWGDYIGKGKIPGIVIYKGQIYAASPDLWLRINRALAFTVETPELKSRQGVFGAPLFIHTDMDVSEAASIGSVDYISIATTIINTLADREVYDKLLFTDEDAMRHFDDNRKNPYGQDKLYSREFKSDK